MLGRDFSEKKLAQLVNSVRSTFQKDLHPPIGGPHPVLYSQPRQQRNIAQQCARLKPTNRFFFYLWKFSNSHKQNSMADYLTEKASENQEAT